MEWSLADVLILIGVAIVIAVAFFLIRDAEKKGVPVCGKACGGCPHPCHIDGTPRQPSFPSPTVPSAAKSAVQGTEVSGEQAVIVPAAQRETEE